MHPRHRIYASVRNYYAFRNQLCFDSVYVRNANSEVPTNCWVMDKIIITGETRDSLNNMQALVLSSKICNCFWAVANFSYLIRVYPFAFW